MKTLLLVSALLTPLHAQDAPPKIHEIEQKVLEKQYQAGVRQLAESAGEVDAPGGPSVDLIGKRAMWLTQLLGQIESSGLVTTGDDQEEMIKNATTLNEMAWRMVTSGDAGGRHPDIALKLANLAIELAGQDKELKPNVLDTKARALFLLGKADEATKLEHQAIAACGDNRGLRMMQEATLESYEKGQLPAAFPTAPRSGGVRGSSSNGAMGFGGGSGSGGEGGSGSTDEADARVKRLTDESSQVSARVEGTSEIGILCGERGGSPDTPMLRLRYLSKDADVRKGQRVFSTGQGGIVPAGLLLGTIELVEKGSLNTEALVRPVESAVARPAGEEGASRAHERSGPEGGTDTIVTAEYGMTYDAETGKVTYLGRDGKPVVTIWQGKGGGLLGEKAFPTATLGKDEGFVLSPYPPHQLVDVRGLPGGTLVREPKTGEIFRLPVQGGTSAPKSGPSATVRAVPVPAPVGPVSESEGAAKARPVGSGESGPVGR